jgi:hypothetical protein
MRCLFLMFLFSGAVGLYSWDWIAFDKRISEPKAPVIEKLSSDRFLLSFKEHIPGLRYKTIETDWMINGTGERFALFSFPGFAFTGKIGEPKLPIITHAVEIPHGAEVSVRVVDSKYNEINLKDFGIKERIMPVLAPVPKIMGEKPKFLIDDRVYSNDRYYPDILTEIERHEGFARGHKLVTVRIFPLQYNPKTGNIKYYTDIEIELKFTGGDISKTLYEIHKNYSRDYEKFIDRMVLNPDAFEIKDVPVLPIYYDIFYSSDFSPAAESLSLWKTQKGFKVRMWDATGWSTNQIEDTIDAQTPLATYLVIIADPNASNPLPSGNANTYSGQTDLYYSETDGVGYLPDIFKARISVKTLDEAMIVVNKAIRYEKADFGSAGYDWLKRATFIAGYDPYGNQVIGRATNRYCFNLLVNNAGYNPGDVDTLVMASGEEEGRVVNEINEGNIWTVFTAHGGQTEWWVGYTGDFNVTELTNLTDNQDMYTMPCGHCCLANDFDYSSDCFGETWPKLSNKGGISYFGSVPGTVWDEDDWLQRRYFDAIYTDSVQGRIYEVSRFTDWALFWIENNTLSDLRQYYFEAYHVMNDPSLQIWTDKPDTLLVVHNSIIPPDSSNFIVEVYDNDGITPIEDALVCCWIPDEDPDVHEVEYTDANGSVTLNISPTTPGEKMFVTVTKHDYFPYEDTVNVVVPSSWTISPESVQVNTPTQVTVTVDDSSGYDYPGVEIHIYGYGFEGYDTTDISGQAIINVDAQYGELLEVAGRDTSEFWNLFKDTLPVYGASNFTSCDIGAYSDTIGVIGGLMPGISGEAWGYAFDTEFTLYLKGCGVDTSTYTSFDSALIDVNPVNPGNIKGTIGNSGYNIYQEYIPVKIYRGWLSGYITDAITSDLIEGVRVLGYEAGVDTSTNEPVFDLISDSQGFYEVDDSIHCGDYDIYESTFGYQPKSEVITIRQGNNVHNIELYPALSGIVYGTVSELGSGDPLTSEIRIYRTDNNSLYETTTTDSTTGGIYEVTLPQFTYRFLVTSYQHVPIDSTIYLYSDSLELNFVMDTTCGMILVIDDDSKAVGRIPGEDELKRGLKEGIVSNSEKGAASFKFYRWLMNLGYYVDTTTSAITDTAYWNNYDIILVTSGANTSPVDTNDITYKIVDWVEKGGKILIEGGEVGYDAALYPGYPEFAKKVLHITDWDADDVGTLVKQNDTHPLSTIPNVLPDLMPITYSGYGDEDACVLDAYAELIYGTNSYPQDAGILIYDPTPPSMCGQIVYYAFNLDALSDTNDAKALVENSAYYLLAEEPPGSDTLYGYVDALDTLDEGSIVSVLFRGSVYGIDTTDEYGNYMIPNLYDGVYNIIASREGYMDSVVSGVNITGNLEMNFTLYPLEIIYQEDFEDSNGAYTSSGDWEWGMPTYGPSGAHSGLNVWGTDLSGIYSNNSDSRLRTVDIDLSGVSKPMLSFYQWYDTESYFDGGNVKISTNGGTSWDILGNLSPPYNEDAASTSNAGIPGEPCYSGHDQGYWEEVTRELSAYTDSTITLRFHFGSDGSGQYSGWYIDDVMIYYVNYGGVEESNEIPRLYSMLVNSVEFGGALNIKYSLPERARVYFKVYDLTGREIKSIKEQMEAGYHEVNIDMVNYPAGVYFIHMDANGNKFTKKTVLIR